MKQDIKKIKMNINENFDLSFNETFSNENDDENEQKNDRRSLERHSDSDMKYQWIKSNHDDVCEKLLKRLCCILTLSYTYITNITFVVIFAYIKANLQKTSNFFLSVQFMTARFHNNF